MAAPLIRGVTAAAAGGSATSPASTQVGDLVVAFTWERLGASSGTTLTANSAAGFNLIRNHFHNDSSTDGALAAAWKIATQAGAQSYQGFTSSTGSPVWWTGLLVLQAGTFDASNPAPAHNSITATSTGVPNPPAISLTSTRDYLVAAVAAWHFGSALSNTATGPTSYALQWQVAGSANGDLALATLAVTGAVSADPGTFGDNQTPNGTAAMAIGFINALPAVSGSLSATDSPDAAVVESGVLVGAALEVAAAGDTFAGSGTVQDAAISAALSAVESGDAASFGAGVRVGAALASTDAGDSATASGAVGVAGALACEESGDAAALSAGVLVGASLGLEEQQDGMGGAAGVVVASSLGTTEGVDLLAAAGTVGDVATASLAAVESVDALVASGDVPVVATCAGMEPQDGYSGVGEFLVELVLAGLEASDLGHMTADAWLARPVTTAACCAGTLMAGGRTRSGSFGPW